MALTYAGVDEAGYGPMLGPLCVGACAVRVESWDVGDRAPDLWSLLDPVVCRSLKEWRKDQKGRLPVGDSKKIKLSNQSKTKHPLFHLERGVLAFLKAAATEPKDDAGLFEELGVNLDDREPWFAGEPTALPVGASEHDVSIVSNLLRAAMSASGVELLWLGVRVVGVTEFNEIVKRTGTKASTTAMAMAEQLRSIAKISGTSYPDQPIRLVCDRLGGRQKYQGVVTRTFEGCDVRTLEETPARSRYAVSREGMADCAVTYQPQAEDDHLPVALASMAAKLVRELAMARLNRYWSARVPELKPTAGYVSDARRWLDDVGESLTSSERRLIVRNC